ncbi:hypothetical protein BKK48_00530 [Rodentibacter heidelbergensis]|uniref:Uncharacterized protein n=1 Tax=Rodentibacter heidelbergensis TaxID=1908258 RepID=A0A1V3IC19_9PAST|nr:hypothetical protein BKK48_00530 [Rodentibacter heidelbergensis]
MPFDIFPKKPNFNNEISITKILLFIKQKFYSKKIACSLYHKGIAVKEIYVQMNDWEGLKIEEN